MIFRELSRPEKLVLLLGALLLLAGLGSTGLWDPWETDGAAIARNISGGADWTSFSHDGKAISRPPLLIWATAAAFSSLGVNEWIARLPGCICALLLLCWVLRSGKQLFGGHCGAAAALVLCTSPAFLWQGRLMLGSSAWLLGEALCVLALPGLCDDSPRRRRSARLWMLCGTLIAALAVGAYGLACPVLTALVFLAARPKGWRRALPWTLIPAVTGGSLAWLGASATPGSLLAAFAYRLQSYSGDPIPRIPESFELLLRQIGFGAFPWSVLIPLAFAALLFTSREAPAKEESLDAPGVEPLLAPGELILVSWLASGVFAGYVGLASGQHHLFASWPALALAIGSLADPQRRKGLSALAAVYVLALVWMLFNDIGAAPTRLLDALLSDGKLDLSDHLQLPRLYRIFGWAWTALIAGHLLSIGIPEQARIERLIHSFRQPGLIARGLLLTSACMAASLTQGLGRELAPRLSDKAVLDAYRRVAGPGETLYRYTVGSTGSAYYAADSPTLSTSAELRRQLGSSQRAFVLIPAKRLPTINQSLRSTLGRHVPVIDQSASRLWLISNQLGDGEEDFNPIGRSVFDTAPAQLGRALDVDLDGKITLLGASISRNKLRRGGSFELTTHIKVNKRVSGSWRFFVHVETAGHRIDTATTDHEPVQGLYKTKDWRPGDYISDKHQIKVPMFSPSGTYKIWVGLFRGEERMKASPADRHDGHDRIHVASLEVTAL